MPVLPSGRRIEFSLDRFLAMLDRLEPQNVIEITAALDQPDDLLPVVDIVRYDATNTEPQFAGYVATDWEKHADDWTTDDKEALRAHLKSDLSQSTRAEAIAVLRNIAAELSMQADIESAELMAA